MASRKGDGGNPSRKRDEKVYLRSCDGFEFMVRPGVAFQLGIIKKGDIKPPVCTTTQRAVYELPHTTAEALDVVVSYCNCQVNLNSRVAIRTVQRLNLRPLVEVIQAANHLDIQSLMDLSCRSLVKNLKQYKEFINNDTELNPSLYRMRGQEVLINVGIFRDHVQIPSLVAANLPFVERRKKIVERYASQMMNLKFDMVNKELEQIVKNLSAWTSRDPDLANHLGHAAILRLLDIVKSEVSSTQLKCHALHIVGFTTVQSIDEVDDFLTYLVNLLSRGENQLKVGILCALWNLANASSPYKNAIIKSRALQVVKDITSECRHQYILFNAAKFLVIVCSKSSLPHDKVIVARDIAVNILKEDSSYSVQKYNILYACYALQYLSYNVSLDMGQILLEKLSKYLRSSCSGISGSALGVFGNIARSGKDADIEIVISECNLLEYLGMLLVTCKHKKFRMEACQIISNIAVRNKTSIEVGLLFNDVRHKTSMEDNIKILCDLLQKEDDSDVKMEAAWAIFYSIWGNRKSQ